MARTQFVGMLALVLAGSQVVSAVRLGAQVPGTTGHDHLTEVACVDVVPGEKRPEFGCFNVGMVTGLHFWPAWILPAHRSMPSLLQRSVSI